MASIDYVASDVHLGAVPDETERTFVAFLEHIGGDARRLLINGDLFDFWFEYGDVIPGRHFRTLAAIAKLVDAGVAVTITGGNHDAWGGRFLREHVGVTYHVDPFHMELGGRRALVAHGDGLGKGDLKYRLLKAVIRSRAAVWGFRALHPELGLRVAQGVSSTEAKGDEQMQLRGRAAFLEDWARQQLAADASLGFVVCGHSHIPALVEVAPGRHYLNAGDWLTHFSYIRIDGSGTPSLERWATPASPSPRQATRAS